MSEHAGGMTCEEAEDVLGDYGVEVRLLRARRDRLEAELRDVRENLVVKTLGPVVGFIDDLFLAIEHLEHMRSEAAARLPTRMCARAGCDQPAGEHSRFCDSCRPTMGGPTA